MAFSRLRGLLSTVARFGAGDAGTLQRIRRILVRFRSQEAGIGPRPPARAS